MSQGFLKKLHFYHNSQHRDRHRMCPKGAHNPLWDTEQGLHSLLAMESQSYHIHFTPWAVSCCSNDANVCSLVFLPCTPARTFLFSILLPSSWYRGDHLHLVKLSPLPGRVTSEVDCFLITWISKSSLALMSSLLHGSVISGPWCSIGGTWISIY